MYIVHIQRGYVCTRQTESLLNATAVAIVGRKKKVYTLPPCMKCLAPFLLLYACYVEEKKGFSYWWSSYAYSILFFLVHRKNKTLYIALLYWIWYNVSFRLTSSFYPIFRFLARIIFWQKHEWKSIKQGQGNKCKCCLDFT